MTLPHPVASLSLDLDNKWSYMKTHGDPGWDRYPSYFSIVVPRTLEFLAKRDIRITWFVVGQDASMPVHREPLRAIAAAGHEIGNHSFHHEPWLHLYSPEEIEEELARTEEAIESATGVRPVGFRGPGFSLSKSVLEILHRRGYQFDCSTFPTYLGPLARAYYFMTAKLSEEEKQKRALLFGRMSEGLRPLKPYLWTLPGGPMLEIPVTTMPIFKAPIHASYVLYLARFSPFVAKMYFRSSLMLCRMTGTEPSILLHPLDFLGMDDDPDLAFFPAMDRPAAWKLGIMDMIFSELQRQFAILPMGEHARRLLEKRLPLRRPDFENLPTVTPVSSHKSDSSMQPVG